MSNGSPIVAIRNWFTAQPEDVRGELALHVAYPLFDVDPGVIADVPRSTQLIVDWLDDTIARHLQFGRLLSFTACVDYMMRGRDTAEAWAETEEMTRKLVEDAGPASRTAQAMLAMLPARQEKWIKLAAEWYALRDSIFAGRQLDAWMFRG
ncbi:hypothetical protein SAMN02799622_02030 [Methylobacterium sp. UNC378MF]|nr:hypothetical protein SAMN02799622_02030 [Methylobacterium sp. UNC378MF]